jgi:CRISPR/Cas system-associated exonuclease Cas4 (RecB family)
MCYGDRLLRGNDSLIDRHLTQAPSKSRPDNVVYVTDIVKECLRQSVMDVLYPPKHPIETLRIFASGNMIEDWVVNILKSSGEYTVIGTQVPVRWPTSWGSIHGRVDILAQRKMGSLVAFEIKSIKNFDYLAKFKPSHGSQCSFYINVLNLDFGELFYISKEALLNGKEKDGSGLVERRFIVPRNVSEFAYMVKRAGEIHSAVSTKTIPDGSPNQMCELCPHLSTCLEATSR